MIDPDAKGDKARAALAAGKKMAKRLSKKAAKVAKPKAK